MHSDDLKGVLMWFCHVCYDDGVCWALGDDHAFDDTRCGIGVHAFEKFLFFAKSITS